MRFVAATVAFGFAVTLAAQGPVYSTASLVNAADNQTGNLSPNTIATLYGKNLAYGTRAITPADIPGGVLPTVLPGTGVRILIGGLPANLYYVSPTQINFLVPVCLLPGTVNLQLVIDGLAGPQIQVQLAPSSPALFQLDSQTTVATSAAGALLTAGAPARPGDIVILYATGLGQSQPPVIYGQLPTAAAPLKQLADFTILLDGVAADPSAILYAGIAPGFAGLYQINFTIPAATGPNPEIRIGFGDSMSPAGILLPVAPPSS